MMAGVGGPAQELPARHTDVAPTQTFLQRRSSVDNEELEDGHGPDGVALEAAEEVLPDPIVPDTMSSDKYRRLYGDDLLHVAVLDVYCRMAALGGRLMGDNIADTTRMSERQMRALADEARDFIVDHVDLLFGPVHTTKAHRLANIFWRSCLATATCGKAIQVKTRPCTARAKRSTLGPTDAGQKWWFR